MFIIVITIRLYEMPMKGRNILLSHHMKSHSKKNEIVISRSNRRYGHILSHHKLVMWNFLIVFPNFSNSVF